METERAQRSDAPDPVGTSETVDARSDARGGANAGTLVPMLVLLAATAIVHVALAFLAPPPTLFEDEPHYNQFAHEDAANGDTSLLPGRLRFDQRPELISRLWSNLVDPASLPELTPQEARFSTAVVDRARWLNLAFLLGAIVLVHWQARLLGLGRRASLLAPGLVALFPWFGFYVHTLWAEMLHALLVGVLFVGVFAHLRSGRLLPLVPAGLALGVALLAKGTMNPFLPVLYGVLFGASLLRARGSAASIGRRVLAAAGAPAVLAVATYAVAGPQLVANANDGHGYRIAGNRWKNLEMGVVLEPRELQTPEERDERRDLHLAYMSAGPDYEVREAAARERTLAIVEERGLGAVAGEQARKLVALVFRAPSFFERALEERWGESPPWYLAALRIPGRVLWYALLGLGLVGVARTAFRSPAHLLMALFAAYFLAALFVIPYKLRFAIPLIPTLALLASTSFDRRPREV